MPRKILGLVLFILATCATFPAKGQKNELKSMRCDRKFTYRKNTPCTICVPDLWRMIRCPWGWTKNNKPEQCRYTVKLGENTISNLGCTYTCMNHEEDKQCCPGHWGAECYECPGGPENICNQHGTCLDGIANNGTCICNANYGGIACQHCKDENHFGPDCQSVCECQHGICNHGPSGDGKCTCYAGYSGPKCDQEVPNCGGVICEDNSLCVVRNGKAECECIPGYQKIGTHCLAQDPCKSSPCSQYAVCKTVEETKYQCTCAEGYQGNGRVCQVIQPCVVNNGGCPINTTKCIIHVLGMPHCLCKPGMKRREGTNDCIPSSECLPFACDNNVERCEMTPDGFVNCICPEGEIEIGRSCYKTILSEIFKQNRGGKFFNKLTDSLKLFAMGCSLTLENYGPFTVFVPTGHISPPFNFSVSYAQEFCRKHIVAGQHLLKDILDTQGFWTLSGHKVVVEKTPSMRYSYSDSPKSIYYMKDSDSPASNGIIHIVGSIKKINVTDNSDNAQKTIAEILASMDIASRFETILENCGLPSILGGPGPFTVFVPSNEAIDKLRDGRLIYLFTEGINKLQELVKHHIYPTAAVSIERLIMMPHILTMANQLLTVEISKDGRILLDNSVINKRDIVASNGIIHTLDGILIPSSILPILPKKCNEVHSKVVEGSCVDCELLNSSICPPGSQIMEDKAFPIECVYTHDPLGLNVLKKGCQRYCILNEAKPGCCKGFFGPSCAPCPGGYSNPCYDKGSCNDGIHGNGHCNCYDGFKGIACHICSNPNKHGDNCTEDCGCIHGICDNRPGSKGVCQTGTCADGYTGEFCDIRSHSCESTGATLNCHVHATCTVNDTAHCVCLDGYEGDGFSCKPIDTCSKPGRGGCSENATCTSTGPGTVSCQCIQGWTGDGKACVVIDNCVTETRGGCHINADCNYIGPGQSSCMCKKGYEGDGYVCDKFDPCMMDSGGCHELAECQILNTGEKVCRCPDGYMGDGIQCYGDVMKELVRNYHFSTFYGWIKKSLFSMPRGANVTVLVPLKEAVHNLSKDEKEFWLESNMLPSLIRSHILQGSFTTQQLKKYVGQELPTLNPEAKWEIKSDNGGITIQNASIVLGDIPAINSTIYIISKVLLPTSVKIPPGLQEQLNTVPSFWRFKELLERYQLLNEIESSEKYTIFVPGNNSIENYCQASNITQLDNDTMQYHVVIGDKLFLKDLKNGVHRSTMLGFSNWLMFSNRLNKTYVNRVLLDGPFVETRNGMLIGVSQVLQIHKNRCTTNTTTVQKSRCAKCNKRIKCPAGSVLANPGKGNLPHCVFKSGDMKLVGCYFTCVKVSLVSVCCPGYYGAMCEMCPGKAGNWCSGNGVCQDGIEGNGDCQCQEGFHGTACEMCQAGRYGPKCQSECNCNKGQCNDGLLGDGKCTCNSGFKGVNCDQEIETDFCNGTCDVNANCMNDSTTSQPTCSCSAGYSGNGTSCTEINPCAEDNGGCSIYANCTKIAPGKNICSCKEGYSGDGTLCRELDRCLENNGGCHQNATCIKTGPGLVACACLPRFTGDGINKCEYTDPCSENNGGCDPQALCLRTENGNRTCLCILGIGDGFTCRRTVWQELIRRQDASEFLRYSRVHRVTEMVGKGPYTVFVPHADYLQKRTTFSEWEKAGCIKDLLRYHTVICQTLLSDDLESQDSVTALSGHKIRVSMKEDSLYLNDEVKIIESDITRENGVIHFIDGILVPYDLQHHNISCNLSQKTIIEVSEAHGYKTYSWLLKEAGLLNMVNDTLHQPFTMLWPTDAAFNSLPAEMQKWLYHKDHRSKLSAYLKGHMIRDIKVLASKLTELSSLRTLHGSTISFSCSKTNTGDIVIDNGNARIVQRYMEFDVGIAYGIDHLLEPPDLGSRCDEFQTVEISNALCSACGYERPCPFGSIERGEIQTCNYAHDSFDLPRRHYWRRYFRVTLPQSPLRKRFTKGCKRTCLTAKWVPRCCANHYGKNCHVCPGGHEAPCQNRGTCDDGHKGSGQCNCSAAFVGVACELCSPGYYGPDCKECNCSGNGICNEGLLGDGFCFCSVGWTGEHCETKLAAVPQCSPACHPNAVCRANNICECNLYYEGDGNRCTVIDQCGNNNGGCSNHAKCTQNGTDVSCTCLMDYQGDGYICNPIDRCADGRNGQCSEHATCISTGPNTRRCECKAGYVGNGMQCFEEVIPPTDRCLEENGQCHVEAICTDLHFEDKTVGVFHLQSPTGKYNFTYEEAEASCAAEGATLATLQQLSAAQQMGLHLCIVGWLFNHTAGYPTVYPSQNCGTHHVGIVNYGYRNNISEKWDAYCYRIQDVQCNCKDGYIGNGYSCTGSLLDVLAQQANFSVFYSIILDFANTTQEGVDFLNFLSEDLAYKTLFVPLNSGFGDNTSLSLKDVKLHASLRDVILLSFNLTAGTIIPSQAGYNLSIAVSLSHTFLIVSEPINNTVIVDWDILASNGIIHAIQSPLKVPLQNKQVSSTVKPSTAMTIGISTVFAVVLLCATIAGLSYFCLKRRNQLINFRYFRAELDDDEPSWQERSPHLVSIPNPIYGADISIYEPFEESLHREDFVDAEDILGQ
ncbi:stabilin-1 isoform X2 [Pantherophis guttatus]|uniref:Stabilin-1 isoform X2 n=1 Tax=Pantherophis guttatus TaxID=94885 RepID=A0A6P9DVS9_PANGU|nr:stabilin-1 isoform X2 [Pantherophis guttatus]